MDIWNKKELFELITITKGGLLIDCIIINEIVSIRLQPLHSALKETAIQFEFLRLKLILDSDLNALLLSCPFP